MIDLYYERKKAVFGWDLKDYPVNDECDECGFVISEQSDGCNVEGCPGADYEEEDV